MKIFLSVHLEYISLSMKFENQFMTRTEVKKINLVRLMSVLFNFSELILCRINSEKFMSCQESYEVCSEKF